MDEGDSFGCFQLLIAIIGIPVYAAAIVLLAPFWLVYKLLEALSGGDS